MSEPKLISPLLDNFIMGDPISDHNGIKCCPAMDNETGDKYIVKIISVPSSPNRVDALMLTGAFSSQEEAKQYFEERTNAIVQEIESLQTLSRQEGYLPYVGYQVVPMEDSIGFDVYIMTPYRRSLERQFEKKPLSHLDAINLGLDICSALAASRRSGYIFLNLKPSNIYITENGEFKISDLGFMNLSSLKYASIPEHYIGEYTAPEIADAFSSPNETMDVYALGRILYQIYNGGVLPDKHESTVASPAYADEELAQIILKACDPDVSNRWDDPAQMGQMLVSYMQKNGVSDVPIIPIPEPILPENEIDLSEESIEQIPDEPELTETEEILAEIDNLIAEEEIISEPVELIEVEETVIENTDTIEPEINKTEIDETEMIEQDDIEQDDIEPEDTASILVADIPLPDSSDISPELPEKTPYEDVTVEVSEILYQADMLAAMEVPEPVVVPDAVEINLPAEETQEDHTDETSDSLSEDASDKESDPDATIIPQNTDTEEEMAPMTPKKSRWIKAILLIVLFAGLIVGGFLFFHLFVMKNIDNLEIIGNQDQLTVKITSEADDSLLTVSCKDVYGKIVTLPVVNDTATFSDLLPNSDYTITVNITGFHILTGKTTGNYFTPLKTTITEYHVDIGDTAGSAILTFSVSGPDSKQWHFTYSAQGQPEKTEIFSGHQLVLTDLKEKEIYTGYLVPADDLFMDEAQPIIFTANELIQAGNVQIVSCAKGKLLAKWSVPESVTVSNWVVRCYNDATYEQTVTTKNNYAEFSVPDCSDSYTVEVKAEGQKASQSNKINKNTVTVQSISTVTTVDGEITVTWESESTPVKGWIVAYGINGSDKTHTVTTNEKTVKITPVVPAAKYAFTVYSADAVETLVEEVNCNVPSARNLLLTIGEEQYAQNSFYFSLCTRPQTGNWTHNDSTVKYTEQFSPNQAAGFVIFQNQKIVKSSESVQISIIICNEQKHLISAENVTLTWDTMWESGYCYLNIPTLPTASGYYTITVLINSEKAVEQPFTIQS